MRKTAYRKVGVIYLRKHVLKRRKRFVRKGQKPFFVFGKHVFFVFENTFKRVIVVFKVGILYIPLYNRVVKRGEFGAYKSRFRGALDRNGIYPV